MSDQENRRPLASRQTGWAQKATSLLAGTNITPNQISIAGIVAAALAGCGFAAAGHSEGAGRVVLLLLAALFCQIRLLCNLFDGMVAVEAGKRAPDGVAWNEFPDRFADILIFVGIGYAIARPELGWAAAAFSVLTAYVRELGAANGCGHDFTGPMAKQHRMAVATIAALVAIVNWPSTQLVLTAALWIITLGALLTAIYRIHRLLQTLKASEQK